MTLIDLAGGLAITVIELVAIYFWGRGIERSSKGDMVAGFLILIMNCAILLYTSGTSAVINGLGLLLGAFGLFTLADISHATKTCPVRRSCLVAIGIILCFLGLGMQLII